MVCPLFALSLICLGTGVGKDEVEGARWVALSTEQGYARGQVALGDCYLRGIGVPKNQIEAVKWFKKAADQGYAYFGPN